MPDFERVFDKLAIDIAPTPEKKARQEGYVAGKNKARREIAWVALIVAVLATLISGMLSGL